MWKRNADGTRSKTRHKIFLEEYFSAKTRAEKNAAASRYIISAITQK